MSHEIRTPLNAVLGLNHLLNDTELTKKQQEFVTTIQESGASLLAVINQVLDFSKIEAGKLELERQRFDLFAAVNAAASLVRDGASEKGLSLTIHVADEVPRFIIGDITRLQQVLINLLSNAVKFTATGSIRVRVGIVEPGNTTSDEYLRPGSGLVFSFEVADTGIGIPKDRVSELFEAFSQVDPSTTRRFGGTGLGLAISQQLVELMGGTISVDSEEGVGSVFRFTVAARVDPDQSVSESQELSGAGHDVGKKRPLRILVAEDNVVNQMVILNMLDHLGYRADVAANGVEAVVAVERQDYDVVLMDIQMPEMGGIEATRVIRSSFQPDRQPRIIAVTANALKGDREAFLKAGMDDYVSKPIQMDLLGAALLTVSGEDGPNTGSEGNLGLESRADQPGIDLLSLPSSLGPDPIKMLKRVGPHFLDATSLQLNSMAEALEKADLDTVASTAHSVKSGAGMIGGVRFAELASDLEVLAHRGKEDLVPAVLTQLTAEFEQVRSALEEVLD
jgi:CheY-like chemotaxis protein/HPt (histidine-containing phosphotransfer) domain-containing protein